MKIGKKLRERREFLGYTQVEVAKQVHITANYLSTIENGVRNPSTTLLVRLAKVLKLALLTPKKSYDSALIRESIENTIKRELYLRPDAEPVAKRLALEIARDLTVNVEREKEHA